VWRQAVKGRVTARPGLQPVVNSTVLVGNFRGGHLSMGPQGLPKKGRFQQEFRGSFA
jgi:hypothetical protein